MKTKDLIKLLQEADPSGELHIRVDGGIPYPPYRLEGYWDGAYSYLDKHKWVVSIENDKVELPVFRFYDFVEAIVGDDVDYKWEDFQDNIRFEFSKYVHGGDNIERRLGILKKEFDEYISILKEVTDHLKK